MIGSLTQRKPSLSRRTWSPIGLDLGAFGIRAVQLKRERDGYRVTALARHEFLDSPAQPVPSPEQLGVCLKTARFRGRRVVAGLSAPDIQFHPLEIPTATLRADAERAEQYAAEEIQRLCAVHPGAAELETRFWTLPASQGHAPTAMGVGTPRATVLRVAEVCDATGLVCSRISVAAAALARFAEWLHPASTAAGRVYGVLDLGLRQARLVLSGEGQPMLVRQVGTGGRWWTERIAAALDVSPRTAEIHKRDCVLERSFPTPEASAGANGVSPLIASALRRELIDLAGEIKRSYEYVMRCYPGWQAGDLLLVGGGSLLADLPEFLSETLGIEVRSAASCLGTQSCRIAHEGERRQPIAIYAAAVGLVLGK